MLLDDTLCSLNERLNVLACCVKSCFFPGIVFSFIVHNDPATWLAHLAGHQTVPIKL